VDETGRPLPNERHQVAGMKERETGKFLDRIDIAIGMKAMIVFNL
jgi:hypothetical protein